MKYLIICLAVLAMLIPVSYLAASLWKLHEVGAARYGPLDMPQKCLWSMQIEGDGTVTVCAKDTGKKYRVLTAPIKN